MLCYRCGSHVPDTAESCPTCGQKLAGGGVRQATATFSRKKLPTGQLEGSPYKPGDTVAGRYNIKDIVGAGPVGFVYRARDAEVDVDVALKVINPRLLQTQEERKAFQRAMRVGRKLSHPNIVRIYEEGEDQDRPFYTMQYVEGLNLRKIIDLRITKGTFFSLREVEPILAQVCSALDSAHKLGPHGDVRPENVVVLPDLLKITDYGLGLAIPRIPFVQALKGKKGDRYLSPEYVSGGEMDHRADVYSVAVIVGEMLTGLTPDESIPELQRRNPEVPPAMEGLYRKALNTNPLARPKTAGAFYEEFAEITRRSSPPPLKAKNEPVSAVPTAARPRPPTIPMAALEPRRRPGEKPPPPVPDDLNVDREATQSELKSLPGADATQPVDGTMVPLPPIDSSDETQLVPTMPPPPPPDVSREHEVGDSTGRMKSLPARRNMAVVWLVLVTISGVALGSAGGYWLLQRMKHQHAQPSNDVVTPTDNAVPDASVAVVQVSPDDAAKKAEEARLAEEQRKADEAKKAEEARLAEEQRKADEAKKAEEQKLAN
ncbi:MAG: protein kinase domain-containing protein [Myxococcaceae bacterium]